MWTILRHFWLAFVVANLVNGRAWWREAERRIDERPELAPGYRRLYRGYLLWTNVPFAAMGLGILAGGVPSTMSYLAPFEGHPFVLAWWGLTATLLGLATYWIWFGGGAETLARHPGAWMAPAWPASQLRKAWLAILAWNLVVGTALFFGFPTRLVAPGETPSPVSGLWVLVPLLFSAGWLIVCHMLSSVGGWRTLASRYRATSPVEGERFRLRSAKLGGIVRYSRCLTFRSGPAGLHVAVLLVFRAGHPALLIPWPDVEACAAPGRIVDAVELRFAATPGATMRLSGRLATELFRASGHRVPVRQVTSAAS